MATPWVNAQVAYLLAVKQVTATIEDNNPEKSDSSDCDEIVYQGGQDHRCLLLLSRTCKDKDSSQGRRDQHDDPGSAY